MGHFDSAVTGAVAVARAVDAHDAFLSDSNLLAGGTQPALDVAVGDSARGFLSSDELALWLADLPA